MKIFKNITVLSVILLSVIATSCSERIDIDTDAAPPQLVIYGRITTDTMQHAVRITRSSGFFATSKPEGISHAKVTISTSGQTITLTESSSESGLYLTEADFFGIPGQTYLLDVSLDYDNDGQMEAYKSNAYLPAIAKLDSVALAESTDYDDMIEILAWAKLPDEKDCYYSFHAYRNNVALHDSLIQFMLFDSELVGSKEVVGMACVFLDQKEDREKVDIGDKITLQWDILSKEYGEFLADAQNEASGSIPMFSGPPANLKTNIVCVDKQVVSVSGFFAAYATDKRSSVWE